VSLLIRLERPSRAARLASPAQAPPRCPGTGAARPAGMSSAPV